MGKREKAKELFNMSGIIDNAYNWHIWKRAFDLGVAYNKTSTMSEIVCGKSGCNRHKLEGNVYCQYHYDINFG